MSNGVITMEPEVPFGVKLVPLQPVAFVLLHVSVDDSPAFINIGDAERVAVGARVGVGVGVGAGSCEFEVRPRRSRILSGEKRTKATNTLPITKQSRRGNIPRTGSFISLTSNPPPSKAMTISASPTKKVMDAIENGTLSISLHTNPETPATRVEDYLAAGTAKLTVRCLSLPRRSLD